jgi:hypothetical protein
MCFEIRRARNGLILKVEEPLDNERPPEIVCQKRYDDEADGFADFLRDLNDEFGPSASRYSPKRISIRVDPKISMKLRRVRLRQQHERYVCVQRTDHYA